NAFEGIQPTFKQVPPLTPLPSSLRHFSTHAVFKPSWAARIAATYPAGPEPITTTSNFSDITNVPKLLTVGYKLVSSNPLHKNASGLPEAFQNNGLNFQ